MGSNRKSLSTIFDRIQVQKQTNNALVLIKGDNNLFVLPLDHNSQNTSIDLRYVRCLKRGSIERQEGGMAGVTTCWALTSRILMRAIKTRDKKSLSNLHTRTILSLRSTRICISFFPKWDYLDRNHDRNAFCVKKFKTLRCYVIAQGSRRWLGYSMSTSLVHF